MADNPEFKLLITADATQAVAATQQTDAATQRLSNSVAGTAEAQKQLDDIQPTSQVEQAKTKKAVEETELSHRASKEAIRELTKGYPELGAAARSALEPVVLAAFGIAEAFTIWAERLSTAKELLGGIELPDFTVHAIGVSSAAKAYDDLTKAVGAADKEFDSAAGIFERRSKAIQAELTATTNLIQAKKDQAIAELDLKRASGEISQGAYEAQKNIIERGANDQTTQARIDARNADLSARRQEAAKTGNDSAAEAAAAAKIQPGLNDEALEELISKANAAVTAAKEKAEEFRKEQKFAQGLAEINQEKGWEFTKDFFKNQPDIFRFTTKYGANTDPEAAVEMNKKAAEDAESTAANLQTSANKLAKQKADRDKHNEEAKRLAAEAEKQNRGLAEEDDPTKPGSVAWQNAQDRASQHSRDVTSMTKNFTQDVENFNRDAETIKQAQGKIDPASIAKARTAMTDMRNMMADAIAIMNILAADHQNTAQMGTDIARMKKQLKERPG